jgi:hypothetical protein
MRLFECVTVSLGTPKELTNSGNPRPLHHYTPSQTVWEPQFHNFEVVLFAYTRTVPLSARGFLRQEIQKVVVNCYNNTPREENIIQKCDAKTEYTREMLP